MGNFCRVVIGALFLCHFYSVAVDAASSSGSSNSGQKKWTILVFLNADNNLEDAGWEDVQEMEKVGSTDDVNVVVQFDYVNPRGSKRLYVQKKPADAVTPPSSGYGSTPTLYSKVLEEMPEQDMGDSKVFSEFVTWGMHEYPADHYMVIMWNHGSGWAKEASDKGISYDDTSGNHITTNQLGEAIDSIVSVSGNHIDVLGFDACLMSMPEVMDPMVGFVDYVVSSEEVIPWDGYPYDDFLGALNAESDKSPENLVKDLVNAYGASYSGGSQSTKNVTLSAVSLSKLEMVKTRLNNWLATLKSSNISAEIQKDAAIGTQYYSYDENRDLGNFVQNILDKVTIADGSRDGGTLAVINPDHGVANSDNGVVGASLALLKSINEAVIKNFASSTYSRSQGLAVYLPAPYKSSWSSTYSDSEWKSDKSKRERYMQLKWAKTTDWPLYLDGLFLN